MSNDHGSAPVVTVATGSAALTQGQASPQDETASASGISALAGAGSGVAGMTCLRCSYSLARLDNASTCPECGLPISLSRSPPTLAHTAAGWGRTIADGLTKMIWAYPILLVVPLLDVVFRHQRLLFTPSGSSFWRGSSLVADTVLSAALLLSAWLMWQGCRQFSTPHPTVELRDPLCRSLMLWSEGLALVAAAATILAAQLLSGWLLNAAVLLWLVSASRSYWYYRCVDALTPLLPKSQRSLLYRTSAPFLLSTACVHVLLAIHLASSQGVSLPSSGLLPWAMVVSMASGLASVGALAIQAEHAVLRQEAALREENRRRQGSVQQ